MGCASSRKNKSVCRQEKVEPNIKITDSSANSSDVLLRCQTKNNIYTIKLLKSNPVTQITQNS
jgi:hypothetical protein